MRKTRNYKRKNKKSTRKNKKQKGGMFSNENDNIIVGYLNSWITPIFVSKNYKINDEIMREVVMDDNYYYSIKYTPIVKYPLDLILNPIYYKNSNESYYCNKPDNRFKVYLDKLNLLPNLKNINIYRMLHRKIMIYDMNENFLNFQGNGHILELLANYVDMKYNNFLITFSNGINTIDLSQFPLEHQYRQYYTLERMKDQILAYLNTGLVFGYHMRDKNYVNVFSLFEDYYKKNNPYTIPLKDAIEALERAYPRLIARVLLKTDEELEEEQRQNEEKERNVMEGEEIYQKKVEEAQDQENERQGMEGEEQYQEKIKNDIEEYNRNQRDVEGRIIGNSKWVKQISRKHMKPYWYNVETKQTTWVESDIPKIDNKNKMKREQEEKQRIRMEEKRKREEEEMRRKCPSKNIEPNLCVDSNTAEQNKQLYKRQSLIFHPDKNSGCKDEASEKFKKLSNSCENRMNVQTYNYFPEDEEEIPFADEDEDDW